MSNSDCSDSEGFHSKDWDFDDGPSPSSYSGGGTARNESFDSSGSESDSYTDSGIDNGGGIDGSGTGDDDGTVVLESPVTIKSKYGHWKNRHLMINPTTGFLVVKRDTPSKITPSVSPSDVSGRPPMHRLCRQEHIPRNKLTCRPGTWQLMNLDDRNCTDFWLIHTSRSPAKEALDGDTAAGHDGGTARSWYRIRCPLPDGDGADGDDGGAATPGLDAVVDKTQFLRLALKIERSLDSSKAGKILHLGRYDNYKISVRKLISPLSSAGSFDSFDETDGGGRDSTDRSLHHVSTDRSVRLSMQYKYNKTIHLMKQKRKSWMPLTQRLKKKSSPAKTGARDPPAKTGARDGGDNVDGNVPEEVIEHRVRPQWCYGPNMYKIDEDLRIDMMLPSEHFLDLRPLPDSDDGFASPVIGHIDVEILECVGLPNLDNGKKNDSFAKCVLGASHFRTDVINECLSPIWPSCSRRAARFPVRHCYASLFVGIFDDDGIHALRDDFAGRVAVRISALRPGKKYDVLLPLRGRRQTYARDANGAVRLRLKLAWYNERAVPLSYFASRGARGGKFMPRPIKVECSDKKEYLNVMRTIHSNEMPGQLSMNTCKAIIKEFALFAFGLKTSCVRLAKNVYSWKEPMLSCYTFLGWMFMVYSGEVSLFPCFCLVFTILLLIRNYYQHGPPNPATHCWFFPVTVPEIIFALIFGNGVSSSSDSSLRPLCSEPREFIMKRFKEVNRPGSSQGLQDDYWDKIQADYLEFPFSTQQHDKKLRLHESIGKKSKLKTFFKTKNANRKKDELDRKLRKIDFFERNLNFVSKNVVLDQTQKSSLIKPTTERFTYDPDRTKDEKTLQQNMLAKGWGFSDPRPRNLRTSLQKMQNRIQNSFIGDFCERAVPVDTPTTCEQELGFQSSIWMMQTKDYHGPAMQFVSCILFILRAAFNVFTWKDPFLSFWAVCFLFALTILFYITPWRAVMGCGGIVAFGPQNWLIVKYLEWKSLNNTKSKLVYKANEDEDDDDDDAKLPSKMKREVIVPYTPFMTSRFYDWPPEPILSNVT
eukprot:CAMPEP_0194312896 /NCGR_PEP_ID=MMETSP0171-20130528/9804_1 /TAXON_ID=218684 /ORGANISM="Corethron pennatum, Strain L29A3" /LENGTH=1043 /DNA_ID=CAMNT_0039067617 /DNA_START=148 /DNA_END=3279 /DNA_ORIENTATION=+